MYTWLHISSISISLLWECGNSMSLGASVQFCEALTKIRFTRPYYMANIKTLKTIISRVNELSYKNKIKIRIAFRYIYWFMTVKYSLHFIIYTKTLQYHYYKLLEVGTIL